MTKDKLIAMAKPNAWIGNCDGWTFNSLEELQAFANLIRKDQIERDAGICAEQSGYGSSASSCAEAIRNQELTE
jgi:hypothetical protein